MTILIGAKLKDSVLFVSDTLRNIINVDGTYGGIETQRSQKMRMIRKSGIIATAGMGTQGESAARQIQSFIQYGEKRSVDQIVDCCIDVLKFSRESVIKYNPDISYNKLAAVIGGIDEETGTPYLYFTYSDLEFNLIKQDVVCIGVNEIASRIEPQIKSFIQQYPNGDFLLYASTFSRILRNESRESRDVGQQTFIMELNANNLGHPTVWFLNEDGTGIPLPTNYEI